MKLLKEKSREYKGKPYYKYKINIPARIIRDAELKVGEELEFEVSKEGVMLRRK